MGLNEQLYLAYGIQWRGRDYRELAHDFPGKVEQADLLRRERLCLDEDFV